MDLVNARRPAQVEEVKHARWRRNSRSPDGSCNLDAADPLRRSIFQRRFAHRNGRPSCVFARPRRFCRDHLDAVLRDQQVVESIAVIAAVADQAPQEVGEEARVKAGGDEVWLIR